MPKISRPIQKPEIALSTPDTTWERYNLKEYPVTWNGSNTWLKAIARKDKLVTMVSTRYKLLPNEEAVKLANDAAKLAGLKPFSDYGGAWFSKLDDHVIYDKGETRVHALYALDAGAQVNGEEMHFGVGVHNSIDGTTGFGCGVFTFRTACSNMVFAGMKGWTMGFDQRRTLEYLYKKHTGDLLTNLQTRLKASILLVMERCTDILIAYRRIAEIKVGREVIEDLLKSPLPRKVLPEYLPKDVDQLQISPVPNLSEWQLYNDITEAIWHNEKTDVRSKTYQYDILHSAIKLEEYIPEYIPKRKM